MPGRSAIRRGTPIASSALLAAGAFGCLAGKSPVEPSPSQIVVHAVLDMGSREQLVLVERTRSGVPRQTSSSFNGGQEPVLNAEVSLTLPDGTVLPASEDRLVDSIIVIKGQYRVSLDRYGAALVPGGTYHLRVRAPTGEVITGSTTLPRIAAAAPVDTEVFVARTDTLRLAWKAVDGAAKHRVHIRNRLSESTSYYTANLVEFADSTFVLSGLATTLWKDAYFLPGVVTTVVVAAVDSNYYEYYRTLSDPFVGAPPSRLQGGLGVFGSLVPVTVRTLRVQ